MKFDLGKILRIASVVGPLVKEVQSKFKGSKGMEKHVIVADAVKDLLPAIEGATGTDLLDNAAFIAAIDQLIVAEKAALKAADEAQAARDRVAALIAAARRSSDDDRADTDSR
jgi:hypothetical protein